MRSVEGIRADIAQLDQIWESEQTALSFPAYMEQRHRLEKELNEALALLPDGQTQNKPRQTNQLEDEPGKKKRKSKRDRNRERKEKQQERKESQTESGMAQSQKDARSPKDAKSQKGCGGCLVVIIGTIIGIVIGAAIGAVDAPRATESGNDWMSAIFSFYSVLFGGIAGAIVGAAVGGVFGVKNAYDRKK